MKVIPNFDADTNKMTVRFQSNLVREYGGDIFIKIIKEDPALPENSSINLICSDTAEISIEIPKDKIEVKQLNDAVIHKIDMTPIVKSLSRFTTMALKYKEITTEFIPLTGYPVESLKIDIQNAIKDRRSFCIMESYEEYLKLVDTIAEHRANGDIGLDIFTFSHHYVKYGTDLYNDIATYIWEGNMKKVRDVSRLETSSWV